MGLSVTTYGKITLAKNEKCAKFMAIVIDNNWAHKIKNLEVNKNYYGECIFKGVTYPYGSHYRFKANLLTLVKRADLVSSDGGIKWSAIDSTIPFYHLIDFADNEGCLDWEISEVIYLDFERYHDQAKRELNAQDYLIYETWMKTFEASKNNRGVVVFS
ncbi:MAG: hypothetical protein ACRC3G_06505 [Bacteroidales bacterium]